MEIGPITGIRAMPASKGTTRRTGQWAVQDAENRAHPDDENYTPSGNDSGSDDEDGFFETKQEETDEESTPAAEQDAETGQVSYFA